MQQKLRYYDLSFSVKSADTMQGTFSGLGAAFGNVDSYGDVIDRGAFTKTLQEAKQRKQQSGTSVLWPLCWMHDVNDPVGGIIAARETAGGLAIDCQCDLDTQAGREAFSRITKGYATGLSIGYRPTKAVNGQDGCRHLIEIDLGEISVITTGFAANSLAQVDMSSIKFRKDSNMTHDRDWRHQRLPGAPYRAINAPVVPEIPVEAKYATRAEFKAAVAKWYKQVYGDVSEAKRQADWAAEIASARDALAMRPGANIIDIRDYYARRGRTPDGRVIPDYGEAAQRGHEAALRLMAEARKGQ